MWKWLIGAAVLLGAALWAFVAWRRRKKRRQENERDMMYPLW
jgi:hypothetical protein